MVFQALLASIFSGAEILIIKSGFARMKLHSEHFATLYFLANVLVMVPFSFFFFNPDIEMLKLSNLVLLAGLVICATIYNLSNFKGYKYVTVQKAEPIMLSSWIFSIIFAFLFYPEERDIINIILAAIAFIALFFSFSSSYKVILDKGSSFLLIGSVFVGLHSLFVKELVGLYGAFPLYFIRAVFVLLILLPILRPPKALFKPRSMIYFIGFSVLVVIENIFLYWSYDVNGIILTSLFMTLAPIVGLWGSIIFLKEKLHIKNVLITLIIISCIVISLL